MSRKYPKIQILCLWLSVSIPLPAWAAPPAQPSGSGPNGENVAQDWQAIKYNNNLLNTPPTPDYQRAQGDGTFKDAIKQSDAFISHSNSLNSCTLTNINGRTDSLCTANPSHPECVGLNGAVTAATTCVEYFVPASLGCKRYGTGGFTQDEWVVFGDQYLTGAQGCLGQLGQSAPAADKIVSLQDTPAQHGSVSEGGISSASSGISGNTEQTESNGTLLRDGSTQLGYSEGEVIRRARAGGNLFDILLDSPFAEKLNVQQKTAIENAKDNAKEIAEKALERTTKVAGNGSQEDSPKEDLSLKPQQVATIANTNTEPKNQPLSPKTDPEIGGTELNNYQTISSSNTLVDSAKANKRELSHSIQAKNSRAPASESNGTVPLPGTAPKTTTTDAAKLASANEDLDKSLFDRIRLTYRKLTPGFKSYDLSETARAVKALDTPDFFKDL